MIFFLIKELKELNQFTKNESTKFQFAFFAKKSLCIISMNYALGLGFKILCKEHHEF